MVLQCTFISCPTDGRKRYDWWEASGFHRPEYNAPEHDLAKVDKNNVFTIVIPPPVNFPPLPSLIFTHSLTLYPVH